MISPSLLTADIDGQDAAAGLVPRLEDIGSVVLPDATLKVYLTADAQVREASARKGYAENQANRYEQLLQARSASEEAVEGKRQERQVTEAGFAATLLP